MESLSELVEEASWLVLVSLLWGATNPFIKKGGAGIESVQHENKIWKFLLEMKFLFLNWQYLVPFAINQLGAILYLMTIGKADLTLAVPITNSLTFLFTSLFGKLVGEKISWATVVGVILVLCGVTLCMLSKLSSLHWERLFHPTCSI